MNFNFVFATLQLPILRPAPHLNWLKAGARSSSLLRPLQVKLQHLENDKGSEEQSCQWAENRVADERACPGGRCCGQAPLRAPPCPWGFSLSLAVLTHCGCHQAIDWCSALVAGVENKEKAEERREEEAEAWERMQPPRASTCDQVLLILLSPHVCASPASIAPPAPGPSHAWWCSCAPHPKDAASLLTALSCCPFKWWRLVFPMPLFPESEPTALLLQPCSWEAPGPSAAPDSLAFWPSVNNLSLPSPHEPWHLPRRLPLESRRHPDVLGIVIAHWLPPFLLQPIRDYEGLLRAQTWRRAWQPTPIFLPGESHGQRSLVSYSP